jgi:Mce-associated membrane protein
VTEDDKADATGDEPTAEESSKAVEITEPSDIDEASVAEEGVDEPAEPASADTEVDGLDQWSPPPRRRSRAAVIVASVAAVALVALVASAGATAWLFFKEYRIDQQTNTAAANVALDAAKSGTVALLSYSPESLDKDFAAAKSNLTGDFLSYYTQFTEQIVTPAAKQKSVKTTASVVRAAVSEIHPDSAVVLVFINQTTTSKENPDGAFAASSVKVSMKKIDDRWLISAFDPV